MKITLKVEGMMCQHCKAHVDKALRSVDGVSDVNVDLDGGTAEISLEKDIDTALLVKAVTDAGYKAEL